MNVLDYGGLKARLATIDENLVRNELTALERAEQLYERKCVYEVLHPETRKGGDHGNQYSGGKPRQTAVSAFCQTAASAVGKSVRTVRDYVRVARQLDPLARSALHGTWIEDSMSDLLRLSRMSGDDQVAAIRLIEAGKARDVRTAEVQIKRKRRLDCECSLPLSGDSYGLHCCDFRQAGHLVPDRSVDLIVTDPPYLTEYLPLFSDLSSFASRVLKPGGSLFAMVSAYHLPPILESLGRNLRYQWTLVFVMGGAGLMVDARRVRTRYKPVVWFVNGQYTGGSTLDVFMSIGKDKRFHEWGQSESGFDELIRRFSSPGDTILDPFMGGGTTAAVALKQRRRFIGIDQDHVAVEMTRRRIEQLVSRGSRVELEPLSVEEEPAAAATD